MLRGPQTPGELKQRSERLHGFADLAAVHETLERLVERGYVARHERRPGQKEERYEQLLGGGGRSRPPPRCRGRPTPAPGERVPPSEPAREVEIVPAEDRLTRLERELAELRSELASLRESLGE